MIKKCLDKLNNMLLTILKTSMTMVLIMTMRVVVFLIVVMSMIMIMMLNTQFIVHVIVMVYLYHQPHDGSMNNPVLYIESSKI